MAPRTPHTPLLRCRWLCRRYVEKNCFGGKDGAIPIIAAARLGNDAGIIGAAAL